MTTVTWQPSDEQRARTRLAKFSRWLAENRGLVLTSYRELWAWSVDDLSGFWSAIREFFDVIGDDFEEPALVADRMPGAVWYPRARLNYAENILRPAQDGRGSDVAVIEVGEADSTTSITWAELQDRVAGLAASLRNLGVGVGDRVVAVLPNTTDAITGLLATASIGAVWSISSPELSTSATLSRLRQLEPVVLISTLRFPFNGKVFDNTSQLAEIEAGLPSVRHTILSGAFDQPKGSDLQKRLSMAALASVSAAPEYERVPFDHPLWVLFSSGTTGDPKGIVHGHGGMLLELLKSMGLNHDLSADDTFFVAANTSWMVWNTLVNTLGTGATVVCYSGSPTFNRPDRQFEIIAAHGVTMFATGAAYLALVERSGAQPGRDFELSRLRSIMSTGSPLQPTTWRWVHQAVAPDIHLGSDSGGTDICSGFVGSNPLDPVILGELQGPALGVAVEAWDEAGARLIGTVGEMVIRRPMPSMPLYFWNDPDGHRYHDAYFDKFPGVWAHGDWITETSSGGFMVHGRSDATLNRDGVRLGSAEIYAALQHVPAVRDSLVIGVERPDGSYFLPLFVTLAESNELSDELSAQIRAAIGRHASPRHIPDDIIIAPAIPVTHAGKKVEIQVKKLFMGVAPAKAVNRGALANPDSIDWFIEQSQLIGSHTS